MDTHTCWVRVTVHMVPSALVAQVILGLPWQVTVGLPMAAVGTRITGAAHVAEAPGVDDLQRFQPDLSRQNFALFFVHGVFLPILHLNCTPRGNLRRIGSTGGQVAEK